jgi:hypothetical protein
VLRQYAFGIVVSKAPDRSKVKANSRFKEAVKFAKAVLADPEKQKTYKNW